MISKRRIVRSPRFETAPSFCLPPVDFCSGVSPSQAAKSRPAANPSAAGTNAVIAVEAIGCGRVGLGAPVDLSIKLGDLPLKRGEGVDQQLQNGAHTLGQGGSWVLDEGDQGCNMGDALRKDVAVFKQVPAQS